MENNYSVKGQVNHLKLGILLNFILLLFSNVTQSQSLVNTFTYGNGSLGQVQLYTCESPLQLSIAYTNVQASDSIIIYFPNSFEINALPAGVIVASNTGNFIEVRFPAIGTDTVNIDFQLRNCLTVLAAAGSTLNTSDLQFQVYLRNNSGASTYTYNNASMPLSPGTPASVTFSSAAPPFGINALSNANFQGTANEEYYREFEIKINAPTVNNFDFSIFQENDVEHQELTLVDINSSNGTSPEILLNSAIGASNINASINLNATAGYFTTVNNVRTLRFRQKVKLLCVQPNGFSTVRIERNCCSTNFIATANMYGKIQAGQVFYNTYTNVSRVDSTIQPSCGGGYNFDIVIQKAGAIALLDSILIPLNATFIDGIDSIYIGSASYGFIPLLNPFEFHVHPVYPECSYLIIDFFNNYDSTIVWPGFQNYLDTTQASTMGPWLDTNFFYLRIQFRYNCKKQQDCGSSGFHLQGKSLQSDTTILSYLDAPIQLAWRNSCEVDQASMITPQTVQDSVSNAYVGAFVNMDHEMVPDRVSYTFYPNNLHPFDIYAGQNLSGLSCNTITKYRAIFYIPVPDGAIGSLTSIDYSVVDLVVGNDPIPIVDTLNGNPAYGYFVNDTLTIPLDTASNWPVNFSFDYQLDSCPFGNPPNSGGIDLMMEVQAYCASCDECYKTVACTTLAVVVHCPGDCIGQVPMGTESVEMERATFGFRDTTDFPDSPILTKEALVARIDSIIEVSNPSMPDVIRETIINDELSKLYPFDIVKLSSEGNLNSYPNFTVNGTGEPFQFENISFELAHTPIGNNPLFALKYANLKFVDTVAVDSFTVPLVIQNINPQNTGVFGMNGDTLYSFELGIANLSTLPQFNAINTGTFLLHLDAEFWVLPDAATPNNPVVVRGQFVCSTNVNAQVSTFSCDPWGTQLRVLVPHKSITLTTENDTVSHCISNAHLKVRLSGGLGDYLDDFPYEFRPFIGYGDTAFSSNFIEGFSIENGTDTIVFSDTLDKLWNPNNSLLHPLEKPGRQDIFIKANKFCASGTDTIPYAIPFYDFAYISPAHLIDSIFAPTHLTSNDSLLLLQYMFYDSVNATNYTQSDIQQIKSPDWAYSSSNLFTGLFPGLPLSTQLQGIAESDSLHFNLHVKAPDSLSTGHCWLSYKFSNSATNSPNLPVSLNPFSNAIPYLIDSLSVLDTLGEAYHFFPQGFPLDSISTQLVMPVVCGVNNYKLSLRYGCFCVADSFQTFKNDVNKTPECLGGSALVNFQRQGAAVNLTSQLQVNNDSAGCDLTWWIDVANPAVGSNLTQGKLLINIPSGLVLNTASSTFEYYLPGDTLASQSGNYLNDTIDPNYSFQFEDFPTPPTTVLVLAFPSVDTLQAGGHLLFGLKFKLDQSTCNLNPAVFQSNFLYRILEARFTGYTECNDTNLYISTTTAQSFFNNAVPTIQSQITSMATSADCCLQSAATVSLHQPCSPISLGSISFHFTGEGDNDIALYRIDSLTNEFVIVADTVLNDTLIEFAVTQGLYSATVTTSGGLIYVFNSLVIQNHGVDANLFLTQNSQCGGSPITLTAVDSNAINNIGYNNSDPFIATDTLTTDVFSYHWSANANPDSLDNSIAFDSAATDTSYTVIITHLSGCTDTASVDLVVIELSNEYTLNIPENVCNNQLIEINVNPSTDSLLNPQLSICNADSTINQSLANFQLNTANLPDGTYTIKLEYINDSSCVESTSAQITIGQEYCLCSCSDTNQIQIVVPTSITTGADLQSFIQQSSVPASCYVITSDITVSGSMSLTGVSFKFKGGVEFKILNTASTGFATCQFSGCDTLWKGINNFGRLKMVDCYVSDAQYGIFAQRKIPGGLIQLPSSNLSNVTFEKNFIGINIEDSLGSHSLTLTGCTFMGGALLPDYFQQSPPTIQAGGLAGIKTNRYSVNIPPGNVFRGLDNGILAIRSKVIITKPTFINIQPYANYPSGSQYGIVFINTAGVNSRTHSSVYITGAGTDEVNDPLAFEGCYVGISSIQSYLSVVECRIGATDNAFPSALGIVSVAAAFPNGFYVHNNRIRALFLGMAVLASSGLTNGYGDIVNNNIAIVNTFNPNQQELTLGFQQRGISIFNFGDGGKIRVDSNRVSLRSNTTPINHGIYIINSKTVDVTNNIVVRESQTRGVGIYIANSPYSWIHCNESSGIDNSIIQNETFAYQIDNCFGSRVENNQSDFTKYGFNFNLTNTSTRIKKNTINNHGSYGLWIGQNATVGQQIHGWNRWLNTASTSIPAFRDPSNGQSNTFVVKNGPSPFNFDFYPIHDPYDPNCYIDNFFKCVSDNATIENVSCNASGSTIMGIIAGGGDDDDDQQENAYKIAQKLANDSISFEEYNDETLYALKRSIDALQKDSILVLPDSAEFIQLKAAIASSNIPQFNNVDSRLNKEFSDTGFVNETKAIQTELKQLNYQLFDADSLLASDTSQFAPDDELLTERAAIQASITALELELNTNEAYMLEFKEQISDSAAIVNYAIASQRDIETYEREINAIYLETIARGIFEFSESQKQTIEFISGLCPLLGGEAVFKARSLLAFYNNTLDFDDHSLCSGQGIEYRKAAQAEKGIVGEPHLRVFPNPSNDLLNISIEGRIDGPFELRIFNITGQILFEKNSLNNQFQLNLKSINLSHGLYVLEYRQVETAQTFRTRFVYGN